MLCSVCMTAGIGCAASESELGGSGTVEGTVLDLRSTVSGRILERPVKEGESVEPGRVLMRIDCRRLEAEQVRLTAQIQGAAADLEAAKARAKAAATRTTAGRLRAKAQQSELSALGAQSKVAARDAKRLDKLGKYAPQAELDRTQTQAARLRDQVEAARRQSRAAVADVRASENDVRAVEAQTEAGAFRIDALRAQLRRVELDLQECVVRAPRRGFVEEVFFEVGETALAGTPLVRLIDLDEVWVTFYLANAHLGRLAQYRTATVRADAWPNQTFTGTVSTVASAAEFTPRNIQTRDDRTRLVYPVKVRLTNRGHRLRLGMPVEVTLEDAP